MWVSFYVPKIDFVCIDTSGTPFFAYRVIT